MVEKPRTDLKMVAWEMTRKCNLACSHCRASSSNESYADELSTQECFRLIDELASFNRLVVILTGGEALLRKDIFEIVRYGRAKGLTLVMSSNGTTLSDENIQQIIGTGIKRISVSLDGPDAATHDNLRRVPGAFDSALRGISRAKKAGLEFQINSTITKRNIKLIPRLIKLAKDLGAKAQHIFLLVPTGRAKEMVDEELSAQEYEETLNLLAQEKKDTSWEMKVTCAPHFNRILLQSHSADAAALCGRGCMAGTGFCFISHRGDLQPCGYLEIKCGNVREAGFRKAWLDSKELNSLRDWSGYKGKCGICEFKAVCGGCRARAWAKYQDYLREEPYCTYEPRR